MDVYSLIKCEGGEVDHVTRLKGECFTTCALVMFWGSVVSVRDGFQFIVIWDRKLR